MLAGTTGGARPRARLAPRKARSPGDFDPPRWPRGRVARTCDDQEGIHPQLADLTGIKLGSDDLATCHQKLAAAVGAELYAEKILEAARLLAAARIHSERY